jgi:nucleoid-associated protein YgaU
MSGAGVVRVRSTAVWCLTSAAAGAVAAVALPTVAATPDLLAPAPGFTDLLVSGCAAATVVATAWLWLITTDVVVRVVLAGHAGRVVVRRPGAVRSLVLALCGVVALGATVSPARADDNRPLTPPSLSGLPLPDRATGGSTRPDQVLRPDVHLVRSGDSLWTIAEARLGSRATVADIAGYWQRIYARNADLIGPDPGLIVPGQRLELPPTG